MDRKRAIPGTTPPRPPAFPVPTPAAAQPPDAPARRLADWPTGRLADARLTPPRLASLLLALLLVVTTAGVAVLPPLARRSARPAIGWTIDTVRLRSKPVAGAHRLLKLPRGAEVTLLGPPKDGYYPVGWGNIAGWVPTGAIETPAKPPTEDEQTARARSARQEVVAAADLDLLADPSDRATVVAAVTKGQPLAPTGEVDGGFLEVETAGSRGWVAGGDLEASRGPTADREWTRAEVVAIIYEAADYYGQSREDMLRVARCESDLVPTAVNAVGGSYGIFQFKPFTWESTPYAPYDIFDPRANAMAAAWMWAEGRRGEWVCQ